MNRKGSRQVVNDQDLIGAIRQALQMEYEQYHYDLEQLVPDSIYFETATFDEQIESIMTTDILVSPHGAQLTSLAFLRSAPCGTLLEIFPSDYCIPYFFGSLTKSSNLRYAYVTVNNNTTSEEIDEGNQLFNFTTEQQTATCTVSSAFQERVQARKRQLCPSIEPIVHAVQQLVREWQTCRCSE